MDKAVRVRLELGELAGVRDGELVRFRAVPYAAPPVGPLRFAPPQPPARWQGVRDATRPGPIPPQPPSRLRAAMGDYTREQSEDCLTLDIVTPAPDGARRPVVVWLHGGAFLSGAGSLDWYDGAALAAAGDLVFVGVNYRLGPLGFLCLPGCADGLMGLRDQTAALRFVAAHIGAFGGDPENVTLMGQSAGGISILRLLAMEETAGLFRRAIVQSAPPRLGPSEEEAAGRARRLMALLGIDPAAPDAADRLRAAPAAELITLQMQIARENATFASIDPAFPPVSDGSASVAEFTRRAAEAAVRRGVDLLVGSTREEMHAFFVADPAMETPDPAKMADLFTGLAGSAGAMAFYAQRRPGASARDVLGDLVTEHRFDRPVADLADQMARAGRPVFVYRFDWAPPGSKWKACHCIELPFVLGTWRHWEPPMIAGGDPAQMEALSGTMMRMWASFARGGDPSLVDLPWPRYAAPDRPVMRFGELIEPAFTRLAC
ncbi:MAG TPA: carboxylesterase family protein [Acetobacteraceae bacterium]|nr:carboxylesterase family protein [Acetobacteraceae bacterium]